MKLPTNKITTFARDIFKQKKRTTASRLIHPRRDWLIGLLFGFFILMGIMAWSAFMYVTNRSGEYTAVDQELGTVPVYRAAAVSQALDLFAARATQFDMIQAGQPVLVEPESVEIPAEVDLATSTEAESADISLPTATTTATTTETTSEQSSPEDEIVADEGEVPEPETDILVVPTLGE